MGVSMFLFIFITCSAYGVLEIYFSHVSDVSLSDYLNDILAVDQNTSIINCAILCETDCLSFAYDPGTKKCNTYLRKFINKTTPQSTVIQTFVKSVPSPPQDRIDCSELNPTYPSGVYTITPTPGLSYDVYCDKDTEDGPWTVIQNRQDEQVNFYRNWTDYKNGFGDFNGNFWLGLEIISLLTRKTSVLRIQLVSWFNDTAYAQYSSFRIGNETTYYRISVSGFSGNVSFDSMAYHNGRLFTTYDNDNSVNGDSAEKYSGAWWYGDSFRSNLNGMYIRDPGLATLGNCKSMSWFGFHPSRFCVPMMKSRMLMKP